MIQTRVDSKRGCGWRKPRGLYLVSEGLSKPCGKLPLKLDICPCCGNGIKPARGWTWINPSLLVEPDKCKSRGCGVCPLGTKPVTEAGLIWIGEAHYKTPEAWMKEVKRLGVSRRIHRIPRGFKLGETWVFVAHRLAILKSFDSNEYLSAIFHAFRPEAIEYVVEGNETDEEIEALEKRGITPVKVERKGETEGLDL